MRLSSIASVCRASPIPAWRNKGKKIADESALSRHQETMARDQAIENALRRHQYDMYHGRDHMRSLGGAKINVLEKASELAGRGHVVKPGHSYGYGEGQKFNDAIDHLYRRYRIVQEYMSELGPHAHELEELGCRREAAEASRMLGHQSTADDWVSTLPCDPDAEQLLASGWGSKDRERTSQEMQDYKTEIKKIDNLRKLIDPPGNVDPDVYYM